MQTRPIVGGEYDLGRALGATLLNASSIFSSILNTRDLGNVSDLDFSFVPPASQVWVLGYAVRPTSVAGITNVQGLVLRVLHSFETVSEPFPFFLAQRIVLPLYSSTGTYNYTGHVRVEAPTVRLVLDNFTGQALESVDFQFWGKAL